MSATCCKRKDTDGAKPPGSPFPFDPGTQKSPGRVKAGGFCESKCLDRLGTTWRSGERSAAVLRPVADQPEPQAEQPVAYAPHTGHWVAPAAFRHRTARTACSYHDAPTGDPEPPALCHVESTHWKAPRKPFPVFVVGSLPDSHAPVE